MFAIVDIETTGGNAQYSGITEIAIVLHNGVEVEGRWETLIDPQQHVPRHITALTGISDHMLAGAPTFKEVAPRILNLLQGRTFVAHNVNFDYSFIHHHLAEAGYAWQAKKLCTVRYSRKVFPGHASYSLGRITAALGINILNRHRAGGDADATAALLALAIQQDEGQHELQKLLRGRNPNSYLPMHVPAEQIDNLPYCAGVYYFHDKTGKVLYVGKARNLKYRVRSHFSSNDSGQRRQEFIRNIYSISYQVCATELMALVLEAIEIKRIWPLYNRSQKRFEQLFGLYSIEDQQGLLRFAVEKKRKYLPAIHSFHRQEQGFSIARRLMDEFEIEEQLLFATSQATAGIDEDARMIHNRKVKAAINHLKMHLPTLAIVQQGSDEKGHPMQIGYLIEQGRFAGMGYVHEAIGNDLQSFMDCMTTYPDYDFIRSALLLHAERFPNDVIRFNSLV